MKIFNFSWDKIKKRVMSQQDGPGLVIAIMRIAENNLIVFKKTG